MLCWTVANAEPYRPDLNPCWVNYKLLPHQRSEETNYSVGLETHGFDTDGDGRIDTVLMFQILTEGQGDLVYSTNDVPLFVALDIDQDGYVDIVGVIDDEVHTCRIY